MLPEETTVRNAYARCRRLARRHYENFPVASLLLPADKRDALAAIYAFARYADDMADEPGEQGRLQAIAAWRVRLKECFHGKADHPVFVALADTVRKFQLSPEHFERLLRAFESDVRVNRHPDFSSLLDYCRDSANPVGQLVLELFGYREPELFALSDCICTALQLTNFWQDIAVDLARDRIYLPLADLARFDYSLDDLRAGCVDERWRRLLGFEIARTREFFERGKSLPEKVAPGLQRQLRSTWRGGMTILAKIEAAGYDVFRKRARLGRWDFVGLYFKSFRPLAAGSLAGQPPVSRLP